jgi:thiamine pyrophosphate-dependent acetolactate synthase large subunit-like protein
MQGAILDRTMVNRGEFKHLTVQMHGVCHPCEIIKNSGVHLGPIEFVLFAQSLGATGLTLHAADQIPDILAKAKTLQGPVLVHVKIDYQDNPKLFEALHDTPFHP